MKVYNGYLLYNPWVNKKSKSKNKTKFVNFIIISAHSYCNNSYIVNWIVNQLIFVGTVFEFKVIQKK